MRRAGLGRALPHAKATERRPPLPGSRGVEIENQKKSRVELTRRGQPERRFSAGFALNLPTGFVPLPRAGSCSSGGPMGSSGDELQIKGMGLGGDLVAQ